jgi:hypothetical protein
LRAHSPRAWGEARGVARLGRVDTALPGSGAFSAETATRFACNEGRLRAEALAEPSAALQLLQRLLDGRSAR